MNLSGATRAQKLQDASSTLTILPPCPFCLCYDVSKVSIRTVRSSGRQSTPDLPQSSTLPGRHPKPVVPSLRVFYSSFSTVSFHHSPLMKPLCFFCFPQSKQSFSPWMSLAEQPESIPTTPTTSLCLLHVRWGGGKSWSLRPLNQSVSCTVTYITPHSLSPEW